MYEPTSRESDGDAPHLPFPYAFALPLLSSLFVLPLLEWQRAVLRTYQEALEDPAWRERWEEGARNQARRLMEAYLDYGRSRSDFSKQWVAWQVDLVRGCLETLDGVLRSLDAKRSR